MLKIRLAEHLRGTRKSEPKKKNQSGLHLHAIKNMPATSTLHMGLT